MALLKDGTRIYGNATVDGTIAAGNIQLGSGEHGGNIQIWPNSSGDGLGYSTLRLVPDNSLESNDQYVILDPTIPNHIHIRAGGYQDDSAASLFFGGENSHVEVSGGPNPPVVVMANGNTWTFGTDGNLALPGSVSGVNLGLSGNITFSDTTIQTTAYQVVKSGFNAVNPSISIDNCLFNLDNAGNPTVGAISGTWGGPYSVQAQLWDGNTYPVTTHGSNAATWSSIASYGFGVTFANAGDQVVGHFTNGDQGHIYRVTWIASPSGASIGYGFIQVERLV
jgi:hypothetical protein